jgi:hypothetical protein
MSYTVQELQFALKHEVDFTAARAIVAVQREAHERSEARRRYQENLRAIGWMAQPR